MSCKVKINKIKRKITVKCSMSLMFEDYIERYASLGEVSKRRENGKCVYEFNLAREREILKYLDTCFDNVIVEETGFNGNTGLFEVLDKSDINKIHRLLAQKYHPDKETGSTEMMAFINNFFDKLK